MTQPGPSAAAERIEITCRRCGRLLRRPARDATRMIRCPACGAWVVVPAPRRERPAAPLVITAADLLPEPAAPPRAAAGPRHTLRPPPRIARAQTKHVGKKCPYCITPIAAQEEMTLCPECGIPHHAECWAENGGCTTYGCRAAPRRVPVGLAVQPAEVLSPDRDFRQVLDRVYTTPRQGRSVGQGCAQAGAAVAVVFGVILLFGLLASGARTGGLPIFGIFLIIWGISRAAAAARRQ